MMTTFPVVSASNKSNVFKNVFIEQVKGGGTEGVLAPYEVDKYNRLVTSKVGKEAMKQGFEDPDVQAMKKFNPATKKKCYCPECGGLIIVGGWKPDTQAGGA